MYDLESKRLVRSRNVLFHENKFNDFDLVTKETVLKQDDANKSFDEDKQFTIIPPEPTVNPIPTDHEENNLLLELRSMRQVDNIGPTRWRKAPERFRPDECHIAESLTAENEEPRCIEEALRSKHSDKRKQALEAEYNSLLDNETWELVPPPENSNIVGSKWVLKLKRMQMETFIDIKLDSWHKDIPKLTEWIMKKCFLPWSDIQASERC